MDIGIGIINQLQCGGKVFLYQGFSNGSIVGTKTLFIKIIFYESDGIDFGAWF